MTRIVLQYAIPILLPFALYFAYVYFGRRRQAADGPLLAVERIPWLGLLAAGAVLVALTLGTIVLLGGEEPGKEYVPPHMIDGKIEPGQFR